MDDERDKQKLSLYIPIAMHEALRTIAFTERTSINKLVIESVAQMLARRKGKAPKKGR